MQIYTELNEIELELSSGSVVTLGNFDGLHVAHRSLVQTLKEDAIRMKLPSVVVTYSPNPALVLGKNKDFKYIYSEEKKLSCLGDLGVDFVVVIPFTKELSEISAYEYVRDILVGKLCARHILLGFNHFFGKNREGDFEFLQKHMNEFSFTVGKLEPVYFGEEKISSSYLRTLLLGGEIEKANKILCKPFSLDGKVVRGDMRGRTIGFPTANLHVEGNRLIPANGVYSGYVIIENKKYKSMTNIGVRPTFSGESRSIEVHILDFSGDLYEKKLEFIFQSKIRDERKFSGIEELKERLLLDKEFTERSVLY